jgi:hypothetical protein
MSARLATGAFAMLVALMLIAGLDWMFKGRAIRPALPNHAFQIDHAERSDRRFLAIWQRDSGMFGGEPSLRIAIWDDGRIWFAEDQKKWGHSLRQGRISADQIARLQEDILKTGVFDPPDSI